VPSPSASKLSAISFLDSCFSSSSRDSFLLIDDHLRTPYILSLTFPFPSDTYQHGNARQLPMTPWKRQIPCAFLERHHSILLVNMSVSLLTLGSLPWTGRVVVVAPSLSSPPAMAASSGGIYSVEASTDGGADVAWCVTLLSQQGQAGASGNAAVHQWYSDC
jgi:hypothetical protein